MARFAFEAIDPSGTRVRGTLEAQTRGNALEQLLAAGQTPVSLREAVRRTGLVTQLLSAIGWHAFDYVLVLRELATLLKAGLSVERAFSVLQGLSPSSAQSLRLGQIVAQVRSGDSLSQAFASVVGEAPAYVARLIAAGEASGRLPQVIARLAANLTRARALQSRLISSLTYPCVLIVTMGGVLWIMFTSVLPRLAPMFAQAGAALPAPTRMLLAIDWFVQTFGWPLVALTMLAMAAFAYALRDPRYRRVIDRLVLTNRFLLDLPGRYEAARFCRNLQTLLDGGLPLERALGAARDGSANLWFRERTTEAQRAVSEGERLRTALAKASVFPGLVMEFAAVGEETGRLADMMGEAASILDDEVSTRLDRLTALVLPTSTLIMGGLVAAIMAGIVSGILAINDLVR